MDLLGTGAMLPGCSSVIPGHMGLIAQTQNFSAKTGWQRQLLASANSIRSCQFLTESCSYYSMLFFYQFTMPPISNRSLLCLSMPHLDKRDSGMGVTLAGLQCPLCKNVTLPHSFRQFEGCSHPKQSLHILLGLYMRSSEIFISLHFPHDFPFCS